MSLNEYNFISKPFKPIPSFKTYPPHIIPHHLQGSAIPFEAYQRTSISEDDVLSPPLHPAAVWLPNSCVCITWEPPDLQDGKNAGVTVAGYKVSRSMSGGKLYDNIRFEVVSSLLNLKWTFCRTF